MFRPRRGFVFTTIPRPASNLYTPEARFPTSGFVYAKSPHSRDPYKVGDFIVWDEHGVTQPNQLQDTFFVRLKDSNGIHIVRADKDVEPVLKETVERQRARGDDRWITIHDIDRENEPIRFLASDVVDFGIGSYTESGYRLDYVNHTELHPVDTTLNHPPIVIVPEKEILFFIRKEDLT